MRDLMVFFALAIMLVLSFKNTFSAYLVWGWAGLIGIDAYLYGFMLNVAFIQIFAITTLIKLLVNKDVENTKFKLNRTSLILIFFVLHGLLCAIFAAPNLARNWELYSDVFKTALFCLLMPMLATSRFRIHALIISLALAVSFNGGIDGLKFLASAGSHQARGNNKYGDNNNYAMVISMGIPLLLYLFYYSRVWFVRWGFLATLVLSALAVVATNSRGGLVAMAALGVWIVVMGKRKLRGLIVIAVVSIFIVQMAPESWTTRMESIDQATADSSFMGRVGAWKRASAIALENPILGGGFHAGQDPGLFNQFRYKQGLLGFIQTPDIYYPAASHSIYFETMGDLGFVGLFIFLALFINAFITRKEIKKLINDHAETQVWIGELSDWIAGSIIVYMVAGALLSAAYFDFPYILIMMMEVLKQHAIREQFAQSASTPLKP